jgi:hypothetical protein
MTRLTSSALCFSLPFHLLLPLSVLSEILVGFKIPISSIVLMFNVVLFIVGVLLICYQVYRRRCSIASLPFPPGPKGIPLIGRMLPKKQQWLTFTAWGKEFGMS